MSFSTSFSKPMGRRTGLALLLVAVIGFQLWHLYGLHVAKDLPLWDESAYVGWGDEFLQDGRVGSITNSPFYHVLYGAVISVFGLVPGFYAMQYVLKLALTALVVLLVHRFSRSVGLSALVGVFFAYSYYHLNCEVLVYYGALVPYLAAILVARRAPVLSLGLSFLAGLGRLEHMAVPIVHLGFLLIVHRKSLRSSTFAKASADRRAGLPGWHRLLGAAPAAIVWAFNLFVLTRVTVWQFHNRVWFAWSQNYASFRYLTGQDSGGNPWLDHQTIAQRDFPGAHSLGEALTVNPVAVLEHTWFNLSELPRYLAGFVISDDHMAWPTVPLWVLAAIAVMGLGAWLRAVFEGWRRTWEAEGCWHAGTATLRREFEQWGKVGNVEFALCLAGVIAALPGLIVSTKTNYIMSLVPLAVFGLGFTHREARRFRLYARWNGGALVLLSIGFAARTIASPATYSTQYPRGPVYEDVTTLRRTLAPFQGLKILGVSSASYVNYLGRARHHAFVEPLAISPVNHQAENLSLAWLVEQHQPDALLINSQWRGSNSFGTAMAGFGFDGWERVALRDGEIWLRRGLILCEAFRSGWYGEERSDTETWRWSSGDASIAIENAYPGRAAVVRFVMRSARARDYEIRLNSQTVTSGRLEADSWQSMEVPLASLVAGMNHLELLSREPPAEMPGDSRPLTFCVRNFEIDQHLVIRP
jgi:hypothetical protein